MEDGDDQALNELCSQHPELESSLRRRIELLATSGMLETTQPAPLDEKLADFELHEELGRGGMGVVYRAEQKSLRRSVAVKLIRDDGLLGNDRLRERFRREIEAATRLSHPSIVQVYAGNAEGETPFLAMEFVRGAPLSAVLHALRGRNPATLQGTDLREALAQQLDGDSSEWNRAFFERPWEYVVLDLMVQVTAGVVHAHDRGVWHRDLKPSNLVLTSAGHVKILDFGLAALRGVQSMTKTGTFVGSLPYMAPESLRSGSKELSEAADVYSLGVVFYELLTLRRPYDAESAEHLLHEIFRGRRTAPERVNSNLRRETSLVCQRALEPEVQRRFHHPEALFEELQSLARGQEIRTRPPSIARRASDWVRRSPVQSALLATALVVGVSLAAVLLQQGRIEKQALAETENRDLARDSVQRILALSRRTLIDLPRDGQVARAQSLDAAVEMWQPYYERAPDDAEGRDTWIRLCRDRARMRYDMGRVEEAEEEFRQCETLLKEARIGVPAEDLVHIDLACVQYYLARCRWLAGDLDEAMQYSQRCLELFEEVAHLHSDDPVRHHELQSARSMHVMLLRKHEAWDEALSLVTRALEDAEAASHTWPDSEQVLEAGARLATEYADVCSNAGFDRPVESVLERWQERIGSFPGSDRSVRLRQVGSDVWQSLARVAMEAGERERQLACLDAAEAAQRSLVEEFGTWAQPRYALGLLLQHRAVIAFEGPRPESGVDDALESIELLEWLVQRAPNAYEYRGAWWLSRSNYAFSLLDSDPEEAAALALDLLDECAEFLDTPWRKRLGQVGCSAAATHSRGLAYADRIDDSLAALEEWDEAFPHEDPWFDRLLADAWNEWVLALRRSETVAADEKEELEEIGVERMFELLERAVDRGYANLAELRSTESLRPFDDDPRMQNVLERVEQGAGAAAGAQEGG